MAYARNNLVWHAIKHIWETLLESWTMAKSPKLNQSNDNHSEQGWKPPIPGYLKCNIDTALFLDMNSVGLGDVPRDECGNFIAAKSGQLQCTLDPNLA